jgi:hypothetical protein
LAPARALFIRSESPVFVSWRKTRVAQIGFPRDGKIPSSGGGMVNCPALVSWEEQE